MKIENLLSFIPDDLFAELAIQTGVDHYAKKLQGEVIFKLLLYCIITGKNNSLRTMESAYEKVAFQLLNQRYSQRSIRFSSISERLATIELKYFEQLYQHCVETFKKSKVKGSNDIIRFDSTIVSLSAKLLEIGYQLKGDSEKVKQLKFTIGFSDIPEVVCFYHEQTHTSENIALKEAILQHSRRDNKTVTVFDRGITARKTYDEFTDKNIQFVTRISNHAIFKTAADNNDDPLPVETSSLKIISDCWGYLQNSNQQPTKYPVRRIEALRLEDSEPIVFITNIDHINAVEITEIYKKRWDIEVFFKFIKQLLNFSHLVSRNENGIKVVLYVTMIAAILLLEYKKLKKLPGYKIARQKFEQDLELSIIKDLIVMCGGNPELLKGIIKNNSS